jgi:hypothetical protein
MGEFSKIFTQNIIEHSRSLKEWRMPGADNSLTFPAPKILEGNAVEIVEIDEWVLSAIQHRDRYPKRFDELPLVAALSGSAGLE